MGCDHYKILSSTRVHIERKSKCDQFDEFEPIDHDVENVEGFNGDHDCNSCNFNDDRGFDGKRHHVVIEVTVDCKLDEQTYYILILAQPAPHDGYNLPVVVRVRYCDTKKCEIIRMIRGPEPWHACGDLEYGQDLPKCRSRIPLYFTNGREFVDLRKRCCNL